MNDQEISPVEQLRPGPAENPGIAAEAGAPRLELVSRGQSRGPRPVTSLAKVFWQFAEMQGQMTEQVLALEESVSQEREVLAATVAELPDVKERINWLISSYYELGQKGAAIEQRVMRQDGEIAAATDRDAAMQRRMDRQDAMLQTLLEGQRRWESMLDQLMDVLGRGRLSGQGT
jgi:hypothetical protein